MSSGLWRGIGGRPFAASVAAALVVPACAGAPKSPGASLPATFAAAAPTVADPTPGARARCKTFVADFRELVACERANGTILSFGDRQIGWRVRYFVRYWEMPCREDPTVNEAYVFHLVTDDLYRDPDLDDDRRMAIRQAMYDGTPRCK